MNKSMVLAMKIEATPKLIDIIIKIRKDVFGCHLPEAFIFVEY
jgi:hypothetical protein